MEALQEVTFFIAGKWMQAAEPVLVDNWTLQVN